MSILFVILLLLINFVVGWALVIWIRRPGVKIDVLPGEIWLLLLLVGIITSGWIAFVLAEVAYFSLRNLLICLGVLIGTSAWFKRKDPFRFRVRMWTSNHTQRITTSTNNYINYALLILWLAISIPLFFRPHQFIQGAADAGVYVNLGAAIAQQGRIALSDDSLSLLPTAAYDGLLRVLPEREYSPYYWHPAFFVNDNSGKIVPQFYHLYPVWQAVGQAFGGLSSALILTPLWGILGTVICLAVVRRLLTMTVDGHIFAWLSAFGLSLSALQVWFSRYPTTETLTQLFIWCGLWALVCWIDSDYRFPLWGIVAGAAWGSTFLTRIDTFFLWLIPFLLLLGWWFFRKRNWKQPWPFIIPMFLLQVHSLGHAWIFSRPYFSNTFRFVINVIDNYPTLIVTLLVLMGVFGIVAIRFHVQVYTQLKSNAPKLRLLAAIMVLLAFAYSWFVRPYVAITPIWQDWYSGNEIQNFDRENLIRLGWYLSPLGITLAAAGISRWVFQIGRRDWPILVTGGIFSCLYIWSIRANPHHIYAMRRYVPVVWPFFIIAITYLLALLYQHAGWRRQFAVILAGAWIFAMVWAGQLFLRYTDYQKLPEQITELAQSLPENSILIFNQRAPIDQGDFIGTPLTFLHGIPAYVLRDPEKLSEPLFKETIATWQSAGYQPHWVHIPDGTNWPLSVPLHEVGAYEIETTAVEGTPLYRPVSINHIKWTGIVYEIDLVEPR